MSQPKSNLHEANIPFSWENKPGMSKLVIPQQELEDDDGSCKAHATSLPLPPGQTIIDCRKILAHNMYIPPPPATFLQTPPRTPWKQRGSKIKEEDPFFAAFMECTKSSSSAKEKSKASNCKDIRKKDSCGALEKVGFFSFKCSSEVVEDAVYVLQGTKSRRSLPRTSKIEEI